MNGALGLIETRGLVAAIEAADVMVKAANVTSGRSRSAAVTSPSSSRVTWARSRPRSTPAPLLPRRSGSSSPHT